MFHPLESMVHLFVLEFLFLGGNCADIFCYILEEFLCSLLNKFDLHKDYLLMFKQEFSVVPCSTLSCPHFEIRPPPYTIILQYVYSRPFLLHRKQRCCSVQLFSIQEVSGDAGGLCICLVDQELLWGACGQFPGILIFLVILDQNKRRDYWVPVRHEIRFLFSLPAKSQSCSLI
jgi:hypothetical protein